MKKSHITSFTHQISQDFQAIERPLRAQILIFTFIRLIFNTLFRMVYPFLSVFSRGMGVDIAALSLALTNRALAGMLGPFLAAIVNRRGRKAGMLFGVSTFIFGVIIMIIWPSFPAFVIMLILTTLGKYGFDPSMQAYVGDRVPYQRRGLAISMTELGWSLSFFIGIPLISFLIARKGWTSPFLILALLGCVAGVALICLIERDTVPEENQTNLLLNIRDVLTYPPALAGLSLGLSATTANEVINLIFGVWLEDSFGLKILALAGASAVIGISELSGEGLVAFTTDRLGKPLALTIGLVGNALASILLPIIGQTQAGALAGLFLFYITFEYVMVSHIPMMTELVPSARATMLSMNVTGHAVGRALGAILAAFIYQQFGFTFVALTAVIFNGAGLLALLRLQKG